MLLRTLFGFIGAMACILAALLAEPLFHLLSASRVVDDSVTRALIYRSDIGQRLERAGAVRGEVEVALDWNNRNDLDLHVIDPHGPKFEIFYAHKRSQEGGELDVDANGSAHYIANGVPQYTSTPVEHIVWHYGHAPIGRYIVLVNHYANHGDPDPTSYHVSVRVHGSVQDYSGRIEPGETRTICEFEVRRGLGPLSTYLWALIRVVIVTGAWAALLGTALGAALLFAQQAVYRRRYHVPLVGRRSIAPIVWCGTAAGLAGGLCGQMLYSLLDLSGVLNGVKSAGTIEQLAGWILLGSLLGAGLARRMPNLPKRAALAAGALGGALGCYNFLSELQTGADAMGRIGAAASLGLLIGLMIRLVLETEEEAEVYGAETVSLQPLRLRANRARAAGGMRPPGTPV